MCGGVRRRRAAVRISAAAPTRSNDPGLKLQRIGNLGPCLAGRARDNRQPGRNGPEPGHVGAEARRAGRHRTRSGLSRGIREHTPSSCQGQSRRHPARTHAGSPRRTAGPPSPPSQAVARPGHAAETAGRTPLPQDNRRVGARRAWPCPHTTDDGPSTVRSRRCERLKRSGTRRRTGFQVAQRCRARIPARRAESSARGDPLHPASPGRESHA